MKHYSYLPRKVSSHALFACPVIAVKLPMAIILLFSFIHSGATVYHTNVVDVGDRAFAGRDINAVSQSALRLPSNTCLFLTAERKPILRWPVAGALKTSRYTMESWSGGTLFSHLTQVIATSTGMDNRVDEMAPAGTHFYRTKADGAVGQLIYSNVMKATVPADQEVLTVSPIWQPDNEIKIWFLPHSNGIHHLTRLNVNGKRVVLTAIKQNAVKGRYKIILPSFVKAGRFQLGKNNNEGNFKQHRL